MPKKKNGQYLSKYFTVTLPDGTKKQVKVYGRTQKELQEKYFAKRTAYEQGQVIVNENTLFADWVEEYFNVYKAGAIQKSTLKMYKTTIANSFTKTLGQMKISYIRQIHIQACVNALQGKSHSYINKACYIVEDIFARALSSGIVTSNPANDIVKPKGVSQKRRALSEEEQTIFRKVILEHEKGAMLGISLACGLRPGEARALTWDCVDLINKTVTVKQAVEARSSNIKKPKTDAGIRVLPIPDWYMPLLQSQPRDETSPFVFFGNGNAPITEQRYNRAWDSLLREMDIASGAETYRNKVTTHAIDQKITPYYLRHTYATSLAEKGVDMKTAQYLLGHSSIQMTANIYTHVTNRMIEVAREKINIG